MSKLFLTIALILLPTCAFAATKPDTTPPSGTIIINNKDPYTNSATVSLTLSVTDNASSITQMQFSNDNSTWSNPESYYSAIKNWTLSSGDGKKTVYVKFKDYPGNWSKAASDTITLDTTKPTTPVVTDDGLNTASTVKLNADWVSTDSGTGIAEYLYKITQDSTSGSTIVDWTSTKTSKGVTKSGLSLVDGKTYYFQVKAKDDAGNWSGIGSSDGITIGLVDKTAPKGTLKINNAAKYTNSATVTLSLTAEDNSGGSGVYQMQFSNDNSSWSSPEGFNTTKTWSLSSGDGTKTIYAKFSDKKNNWSSVIKDTITLDATKPTTPIVTDDGLNTAVITKLHADWVSTDSGTGIAEYQYKITQDSVNGTTIVDWTSTGSSKGVTKSGLSLVDGKTYYFQVKARDDASNWSGIGSSDGITIGIVDKTAPTGTIKIINDTGFTNSTSISLTLSAVDSESGMGVGSQMQFSNNNSSWSSAESYNTAKTWSLSSGDGKKTVYVKFKDVYGNWSKAFSDTITLDTSAPTGTITINGGAESTNSTAVTLKLSAVKSTSGIVQMQFSNDNSSWSAPETYSTSKSWALGSGEGIHTVYVKFRDGAGNWSSAYSDLIILDTLPPKVSNVQTSNISSSSVSISWDSNESATGQIEYGLSASYGTKSALSKKLLRSCSMDLSKLKEYTLYHFRIISIDELGNQAVSGDYTFTTADITPPAGSIKINNDAKTTNSTSVTLTISATDSGTGLSEMKFSNDYLNWSSPELYATTKAWVIPSDLGLQFVYVKFKDKAGNWSIGYHDYITLEKNNDKTPPTGTIKINNDAVYSNSAMVTLNLSAQDETGGSGLSQMKFSNDNSTWSTAESYTASKSWTLSSSGGLKTVYAKFSDAAGNWSNAYSDTLTLDTTKPATPVVTDDGATTASAVQLHAAWNSSDALSGIAEYQYKITQDSTSGTTIVDWISAATAASITKTGLALTAGKTYYFSVKAKDGAGNWSDVGSSDGIKVNAIDTTAPTGTIKINNDAQYTTSSSVTLNISAEDNAGGSGMSWMELSNDNISWVPEDYVKTKLWNLSSTDGTKTVYIKFKDVAGNSSSAYSDTIILDTTKPATPIVTDDGVTTASTATLHAYWAASDAASGLAEYKYKITQDSISGTTIVDWTSTGTSTSVTKSGLTLTSGKTYYFSVKARDKVELWSDVGYSDGIKAGGVDTTAPIGTIKINNDAQYTNSASVSLTLSATDADSGMGAGAQMKFSNDNSTWSTAEAYAVSKTWTLTSGEGTKIVYVKFKDAAGNWSIAYSDAITLDTTLPQITKISPADGSTFYENTTVTISPTVQDTNIANCEFQFSIDNIVKQAWSKQTSYSWTASSGKHNIKVEIRDAAGTSNKQVEVYIFLKPLEP